MDENKNDLPIDENNNDFDSENKDIHSFQFGVPEYLENKEAIEEHTRICAIRAHIETIVGTKNDYERFNLMLNFNQVCYNELREKYFSLSSYYGQRNINQYYYNKNIFWIDLKDGEFHTDKYLHFYALNKPVKKKIDLDYIKNEFSKLDDKYAMYLFEAMQNTVEVILIYCYKTSADKEYLDALIQNQYKLNKLIMKENKNNRFFYEWK